MVILDKAPRKSGSAPDAEGGSMVFLGGYSAVFLTGLVFDGFPSRPTWDVCKLRDNKRSVCRHASAKANSAAGFSDGHIIVCTCGGDLDIDRILL